MPSASPKGDLEQRLAVTGSEEIGALAEAMNRMAAQLNERMRTVLRQRNEQEAVLASMVEGVLAVDNGERILRLNGRRRRLFGRAAGGGAGAAAAGGDPQGRPAALRRPRPGQRRTGGRGNRAARSRRRRFLQAHGTPLRDAEGREIGALIVLNDVTRLRRLENVRRDFVANVSHELKTPITAIKGSAETLLDGAVGEPEAARRFVGIIVKQADRLNAIINDLLMLSRIEQGDEREGLPLAEEPVRPVLEAAMQDCQDAARDKTLNQSLLSGELQARINPPLLEQAIVNLLTNAINYSEPGGTVAVEAAQLPAGVNDPGPGLGVRHRPRASAAPFRALLPGGQGAQPQTGGDRPGAGHRQAHRSGARRTDNGAQHAGGRERLHHSAARLNQAVPLHGLPAGR